eukprot:TRINITY_DN12239_c0_g1_i1.p2 TRINITY_DN12239_c0_g1~~TRINITY_DN12239_c0_g1_i1.p2  ORF type:complete len:161 (+),score=3.49 TRINITY_DN12239_c0_g1_i1:258-740(+)
MDIQYLNFYTQVPYFSTQAPTPLIRHQQKKKILRDSIKISGDNSQIIQEFCQHRHLRGVSSLTPGGRLSGGGRFRGKIRQYMIYNIWCHKIDLFRTTTQGFQHQSIMENAFATGKKLTCSPIKKQNTSAKIDQLIDNFQKISAKRQKYTGCPKRMGLSIS